MKRNFAITVTAVSSISDDCNTIDASIEIVKIEIVSYCLVCQQFLFFFQLPTKSKRKRFYEPGTIKSTTPIQGQTSPVPAITKLLSGNKLSSQTMRTMIKTEENPTPNTDTALKLPTPQNRKTTSPLPVKQSGTKKHSVPMFSDELSIAVPESPIFNRAREPDLSEATFMSDYAEHHKILQSPLDGDWQDLSQHETLASEENISSLECCAESEGDTLNVNFQAPNQESFFRSSPHSDYGGSMSGASTDNQMNFQENIVEQLRTQNLNQSFMTQQNHQISMQLQNFECFLREKLTEAEESMSKRLARIEESNLAIMTTLNDLKRVTRDAPKQIHSDTEFVMPKVPISRDFNLVLLNSLLQNRQYMKKFVSIFSTGMFFSSFNFFFNSSVGYRNIQFNIAGMATQSSKRPSSICHDEIVQHEFAHQVRMVGKHKPSFQCETDISFPDQRNEGLNTHTHQIHATTRYAQRNERFLQRNSSNV